MAQVSAEGEPADLAATVDLGSLARQVARACHAELREALKGGGGGEGEAKEPKEALQEALKAAKARLLRLSILVHGSCQEGPLENGLAEAQRCRGLERHAYQLKQFGDHMARMHRDLHLGLATRQHDVEGAAALLRGGDLGRVGLPAMAGDLVESLQRPFAVWRLSPERYAAARERLVAGALDCLAESSLPRDRERLRVEVRADCVQFVAPGAFTVDAVYDLQRWVVTRASTVAGSGHGVAVGRSGEQALRRHLQAMVAAEPSPGQGGDVPAAICAAAHAFCSHLWLRVLHSEALQLARERQWELGSVWWDRRGFLLLRVCPQWDPTCGGLCQAQDAPDPTGGSQAAAGEEEAEQREEEDTAGRRGCAVELHADPEGGIRFQSSPDLGLAPLSPVALEAGGAALLERLIAEARGVLAARHLQRVRTALVDGRIVPAKDVELIAGGPVLRVTVRECPLHVLMDAAGRLCVCADGWSEVQGGPRSAASLAPGTEGLAARLEDARWEALCTTVSREAAAGGWTPWGDVGLAQDAVESSARLRKCQYKLGEHSFVLSFELLDTELASTVLTLAEWPSIELETALSRPRVQVQGLEPFAFSGCAGGSCINVLRAGLRRMLAVARGAVEALRYGSRVFESVVAHAPGVLALNIAACGAAGAIPLAGQGGASQVVAPCKLTAGFSGDRLELVLDWPSDVSAPKKQRRAMPFVPPVRMLVEEGARRWTLCGSLRSEFPVLLQSHAAGNGGLPSRSSASGRDSEALASGGCVRIRGARQRGAGWPACRELALELGEADLWPQWPRDLRALSLLADLAAQAVDGDAATLPAHLEFCHPGRLRWRLPGPRRGVKDEVFELAPAAAPATEKASGHEDRQALLCMFRWISPRPRFLLAPQLSRLACRTRDIAAALRTLAATAEVVRLAEALAEEEEGWSAFGLGADSLTVEYRGMLGVELHVAAPGRLVCQCLSRRKRREGRPTSIGVAPSFDEFMRLLAAAGDGGSAAHRAGLADPPNTASGGLLAFEAGRLGARLAPLWAYLRKYCVLLQLYMLMRTERGGLLPGSELKMLTPPIDEAEPEITWARLKWTRPALHLVINLELFTARPDDSAEPPSKRARQETVALPPMSPSDSPGTEVLLRFAWSEPEPEDPRLPEAGPRLPENHRERTKRVLRRFEAYFEGLLVEASLRVSRLLTPLGLLGAPQLWMLEEAALLLPGVSLPAGAAWAPLADHLQLLPPSAGGAAGAAWQLRFELAPSSAGAAERTGHSGPAAAMCSVTCVWRTEAEERRPGAEGWDEVHVDGAPIVVWSQQGGSLQAVALRGAPYLLAEVLVPLLESLGSGLRRRASRGRLP